MPITAHQLDNNIISQEPNLHSQQIIIKNQHKISLLILILIMGQQIITCQILSVTVVMKKDILLPTAQILVITVKQKKVMLKLKVNKKVTIHRGTIKVRIKTQQNINKTL